MNRLNFLFIIAAIVQEHPTYNVIVEMLKNKPDERISSTDVEKRIYIKQ